MGATPTSISVSVVDPVACIKVNGRANFSISVDFKTLIYELHGRGFRVFLMDLTDCVIMDSTFLGVMSGFALRLGNEAKTAKAPCIQLLNANERVRGLLDNLGVEQLFKHRAGDNPFQPKLQEVPAGGEPSKVEMSRTCLEAHETLMLLNPNNVPKFKDVAKFLAEDLKKAQEEE
jgi:hypothetical protein